MDQKGDSNNTSKIYLDYNSTTPLDSKVLTQITKVLKENWANPSSTYKTGKDAKEIVENARLKVAKLIFCDPEDIIFTSGGTEANHMIITSVINSYNKWLHTDKPDDGEDIKRPHIITSNLEHDSITLLLRNLEENKIIDLSVVPVCEEVGRITVRSIEAYVRRSTCLISVMLANNETGIIQPVSEIKEYLQIINGSKKRNGLFAVHLHTDAAQAIGKIEVNVSDVGVDFLTIVGHKFYGPRIGAVFAKNLQNSCLRPIFYGGGQEKGYRAGTENTSMIAGLGKAAELVSENLNTYYKSMKGTRDYLESRLVQKFGNNVRLLSAKPGIDRIPNTSSVAFIGNYCSGKLILDTCSRLIASVGAACHSHSSEEVSAVLIASGVSPKIARNAIRLSVGRETTEEEIDVVVDDLYDSFNKIESGIIQTGS